MRGTESLVMLLGTERQKATRIGGARFDIPRGESVIRQFDMRVLGATPGSRQWSVDHGLMRFSICSLENSRKPTHTRSDTHDDN